MNLKQIKQQLNSNDWGDALYLATEEQIVKLIDRGEIDEDFHSRHQDAQEELRCMMSEFTS